MTFGEVRVEGLDGLLRAFGSMDKDLAQDLVFELEEAGEPARKKAEAGFLSAPPKGLRNLRRTPFYARMRIGVSRKEAAVYIAPAWRSTKIRNRKRTKLAEHMQPRLEKAVDETRPEIEKRVEKFLDKLVDDFNRR